MAIKIKQAIQDRGLTQTEVANALGVSKQAVSFWCSEKSIPRTDKIEKLAKLLGVSPSFLIFSSSPAKEFPKDETAISIPCLEGDFLSEENTLVRTFNVSPKWLSSNAPFTNTNSLRLLTYDSDAMKPTINRGDLLIFDTTIKVVKSDAIFVFLLNNELFIKRIQRIPNGLQIISDNPSYPSFSIVGEDLKQLTVLGRVCTTAKIASM